LNGPLIAYSIRLLNQRIDFLPGLFLAQADVGIAIGALSMSGSSILVAVNAVLLRNARIDAAE
jgi:hypothetical protein